VLDAQILTQLVLVEHDGGTKVAVPVEELEIIRPADRNSGNGPSDREEPSEPE